MILLLRVLGLLALLAGNALAQTAPNPPADPPSGGTERPQRPPPRCSPPPAPTS